VNATLFSLNERRSRMQELEAELHDLRLSYAELAKKHANAAAISVGKDAIILSLQDEIARLRGELLGGLSVF
jgi:uncharacterized small protein (DUF1192 family)